jgi:hypothetical protein
MDARFGAYVRPDLSTKIMVLISSYDKSYRVLNNIINMIMKVAYSLSYLVVDG